jgi:hypothetical protein
MNPIYPLSATSWLASRAIPLAPDMLQALASSPTMVKVVEMRGAAPLNTHADYYLLFRMLSQTVQKYFKNYFCFQRTVFY